MKQYLFITVVTLLTSYLGLASPSPLGEGRGGVFVLDMRQGLSEGRVRQIKQMPDGRMAIATTATIDIFDGTRFTQYKLPPECAYPLPGYHGRRQLTCDKSGLIWLRNDRILYVLDSRRGVVIGNVDSLLEKRHLTPSQIAKWKVKASPEKTFIHLEGNDSAKVTCIEHDRYGGLWIGTKENGIIYSNPRRERQFHTFPDSTFKYSRLQNFFSPRTSQLSSKFAPSATNCSLDHGKDGYAWLGTRNGVMVFDKEDELVATIDNHYGLSTDNIQSLIKDRRGNVWVATANGISRIRLVGKDSFDITNYGELDGINTGGAEFRTCQIHRGSTGNITMGFAGGIVTFNPDSVNVPCYVYHFPIPETTALLNAGLRCWGSDATKWIAILAILIMCAIIVWKWRKHRGVAVLSDVKQQEKIGNPSDATIDRLKSPSSDEESDRQFLKHLQETIEANISDESFSVQTLSEKMAMDRTGLYRRLQSLTGMAPSNYIRQIRMEVATRLLQETDLPIADIATRAGFSTTKYFNKVFREFYDKSPAEYRKAL